jgi:hypothetical protein
VARRGRMDANMIEEGISVREAGQPAGRTVLTKVCRVAALTPTSLPWGEGLLFTLSRWERVARSAA